MFTGIIQKVGTVVAVDSSSETGRLIVSVAAWGQAFEIGESVAVQGICLTLARSTADVLEFDVLQETFARTNLGQQKKGDRVNLERALRVGDALGGHFVTGHVDGPGTITAIDRSGRDRIVRIACQQSLLAGIVSKGSIAVEGISLTIAELADSSFSVHIIPHTWEHTSLRERVAGDSVNLELDILGKYVNRMVRGAGDGVTLEALRRAGFMA